MQRRAGDLVRSSRPRGGAAIGVLLLALAGCRRTAPPGEQAPVIAAAASAQVVEAAAQGVSVPAALPAAISGACATGEGVTLFTSPRTPRAGAPLRVVAITGKPVEATLAIADAQGAVVAGSAERRGGPPFFWYAEIASPAAGGFRAALVASGKEAATLGCAEVTVAVDPALPRDRSFGSVWAARSRWDRAAEDLYSAWVEKLFDAPLEAQLSWPALHEVLRDPARNFLHDHLGAHEDDAAPAPFDPGLVGLRSPGGKPLVLDPDCADLPYFLRAYFAFKLGLPFAYSSCTRGGGGQAPRCLRRRSSLEAAPQRGGAVETFGDFLRTKLADTVHSGTGRTAAEDEEGDYYPVPISFESLRPGTIYADPYGHVLVIAKRIRGDAEQAGVLLAVDGQPDGTVSRKRFWRGNFLFAQDPALGGPGFKRFRPVVVERGAIRALGNREIAVSSDYGDWSLEQYQAGVDGFYDRVDDALSPVPLDPTRALLATIAALEEQVKARVLSVRNAEGYFAKGGARIEMPKGPAIFETTGPWEDFSTPSRDLRLLIAVDVVRGFPERVARRPGRYRMPAGVDEVKRELEARLARELKERTFSYERSDGSPFTLSLADVVSRAEALEVAYDPNDCVEIRWGAAEGSDEASTCKRRASPGQQAKMRRYRAWFYERRRPARE